MEREDKTHIMKAVAASAEELHQRVEMHRNLVISILAQGAHGLNAASLLKICPPPSREARLKEAILEAIEVLEESRKAFKSRQLEALRKKLTHVLTDTQ